MKKVVTTLLLLVYLCGTYAMAADLTSTDFIVRDPSIGTGGGYQASGSFKMYSAGNLNVSGNLGTSPSYIGRGGFLQYPEVQGAVLSATSTGSNINLTWTASTAEGGYNVSGYKIGIATTSGGPYTFTSTGNVLTYSYTNQSAGDYFFILQTLDTFGNIIATSNEATVTVQESVSFSLSANTISFGSLTASGARYATTADGTNTPTVAHNIVGASNALNGYTVTYEGPTLTFSGNTVNPATITGSSAGTSGTNQFAISFLSSGSATVPTSYDQSQQNWNFAANTTTTIASISGFSLPSTIDAYYIANAASMAIAGTYTTTLTYALTANY